MTLGTIADVYTRGWASGNPGAPHALVVMALLNADPPLVVRQLAHAESVLCARADDVCDQFRAFEARVRERLSSIGAA
jgi:hypothetical protein